MKNKWVVYKGVRYDIRYYRNVYGVPQIWDVQSKGKVVKWQEDKDLKNYIKDKIGIEDDQ